MSLQRRRCSVRADRGTPKSRGGYRQLAAASTSCGSIAWREAHLPRCRSPSQLEYTDTPTDRQIDRLERTDRVTRCYTGRWPLLGTTGMLFVPAFAGSKQSISCLRSCVAGRHRSRSLSARRLTVRLKRWSCNGPAPRVRSGKERMVRQSTHGSSRPPMPAGKDLLQNATACGAFPRTSDWHGYCCFVLVLTAAWR